MEFGILGTSIWQQNMPLMERLTIDREHKAETLEALKQRLGLTELIYLATCNRVEFIYVTDRPESRDRLLHSLIDFFFRGRRDISFFPNDFYHFTGKEAITHLFRTTSSLESLVVGETQITGQFKQAFEESQQLGLSGPALESMAREALLVAKAVKRETNIGQGCVSMASLAANEIKQYVAEGSRPIIALVGSGSMTTKLARYINEYIPADLLFVNRTVEKAERLADEFGGKAISLNDFTAAPAAVDVIMTATACADPIFDADFLNKLPAREKPVLCIDLAIPRDFSADFIGHDKVALVDIPVLKNRGQGNLRQKFIEAAKANDIVRDAVNKYLSDRIEVSLKPIFHDSFQESLQLARKALDDLFEKRMPSVGSDDREAVMRLVTKLIANSSFQPVRRLSESLVNNRSEINLTDLTALRKEAV